VGTAILGEVVNGVFLYLYQVTDAFTQSRAFSQFKLPKTGDKGRLLHRAFYIDISFL